MAFSCLSAAATSPVAPRIAAPNFFCGAFREAPGGKDKTDDRPHP